MSRCLPCGGTGKIVTNDANGKWIKVTCPYCEGTGRKKN